MAPAPVYAVRKERLQHLNDCTSIGLGPDRFAVQLLIVVNRGDLLGAVGPETKARSRSGAGPDDGYKVLDLSLTMGTHCST